MKIHLKKQKPQTFERRKSNNGESPKVFSYYARGSSGGAQNTNSYGQESKSKNPRTLIRLLYLPSYIALGMILIAGLYSCWLQPSPKVVILKKEGTLSRSGQEYQDGIANLWRRSILNQTKLTVHSTTIKRDILAEFGELSDARIELPLLGRRPTVLLTPGRPAMQFVSSNGAFYVNVAGKVMVRVSDVDQNQLSMIPIVRDETGIPAEAGKNVIPESEAIFLNVLSAQLLQEGIQPESITLPTAAANEADVRIAGQSYYVKFSTLNDPRQAVGAYQTVKAKLEASNTLPKEYIDVRVEEKVFYK